MSNARRKLPIVVNDAAFFLSHRLQLADAAARAGYRVTVIVGAGGRGTRPDSASRTEVDATDVARRAVPLSRSGANPWHEWHSYGALRHVDRTHRPDIVHHVAIQAAARYSLDHALGATLRVSAELLP